MFCSKTGIYYIFNTALNLTLLVIILLYFYHYCG